MGTVKHIALKVSLAVFFVMTVLGLIMGLPSEKIAIRAVVGAGVSFLASFIALRMAIGVMVQAVIETDDTFVAVDVDDEDEAAGSKANESADPATSEAEKQLATQE